MKYDYEENIWGYTDNKSLTWFLGDLKIKRLRKTIRKYCLSNAAILDFGSGGGKIASIVRTDFKNVLVADISFNALRYAREKGIFAVQSNNKNLPLKSSRFDYIYAFDVLEHLDQIESALSEFYRILKPGYFLHIHIPLENQPLTLWWCLKKIKKYHWLKEHYAGHLVRYSKKQILFSLQRAGFVVNEKYYCYHFLGQIYDFSVYYNQYLIDMLLDKPYTRFYQKQMIGRRLLIKFIGLGLLPLLKYLSYFESIIAKHISLAQGFDVVCVK